MVGKPGVVVGLSGGVDSSVAAALLLQQGYHVIGAMIDVWKDQESQYAASISESAAQDAKRVADCLGIPFIVVNAESDFQREVVQPFVSGYLKGITPSPCSLCNRQLKGKVLLRIVEEQGAQYAATGHYARLLRSSETEEYELLKGVDPNKDQSYMLALVDHKDLRRFLFPVGAMLKSDIRKMASEMGLPVADRKDSQDLCFLPDGDYRGFLKRYTGDSITPGKIVNTKGEVLGTHEGLPFYTIGQRKGIRVAAPQPLYVLQKDIQENRLVVGELDELGRSTLVAQEVNWISGVAPDKPFRAEIKVRYRSAPKWGLVIPHKDGLATVQLDKKLRDITPGQVAVFYDGEKIIGGGVID